MDNTLTAVVLQGKQVEMSDVLELRNAANDAKDLRQPLNLREQVCWPWNLLCLSACSRGCALLQKTAAPSTSCLRLQWTRWG